MEMLILFLSMCFFLLIGCFWFGSDFIVFCEGKLKLN